MVKLRFRYQLLKSKQIMWFKTLSMACKMAQQSKALAAQAWGLNLIPRTDINKGAQKETAPQWQSPHTHMWLTCVLPLPIIIIDELNLGAINLKLYTNPLWFCSYKHSNTALHTFFPRRLQAKLDRPFQGLKKTDSTWSSSGLVSFKLPSHWTNHVSANTHMQRNIIETIT